MKNTHINHPEDSVLTGVSVTFTASICVTLFTLCGVTVLFLTTVLGDFLTVVDLTADVLLLVAIK